MEKFKSLKNIFEELGALGGMLRATNLNIIDSENLNYSATEQLNYLYKDENVYKLDVLSLDVECNQKLFSIIQNGNKVQEIPQNNKILGYSAITLENKNNPNGRSTNLTFVFTEPLDFEVQ